MSVVRVLRVCGAIAPTAVVTLVVLLCSAPAQAFWPPLRSVQEWVEMDGYTRSVHFAVNDPSRSPWREGNVVFPGEPGRCYNIFNLTERGGVVTWWAYEMTGGANTAREIWYAVYDPAVGEWRSGHKRYDHVGSDLWSVASPDVDAGVVTWSARQIVGGSATGHLDLGYAAYDPSAGSWQQGSRLLESSPGVYWIATLMSENGLVAWHASKHGAFQEEVGYRIYDPVRHEWGSGEMTTTTGYYGNVRIVDEAVKWNDVLTSRTRGYDSAAGSWYSGSTKPVACFYASLTQANSPRIVWFLDMSIGAATWSLDFGDGEQSTERGTWHPYSWGVHTATYTVTGPAGTASESQAIRIGVNRAYVNGFAPGPVHDGSSWDTAFRTVQEGITAVLPGGEVWVRGTKYWERITLKPDTALYAGFVGTETTREQRDWRANPAILLAPADPPQGSMVTVPQGAKATTILDGFWVSGGRTPNGGGILCEQASPVIRNCTVSDCVAVAAIGIESGRGGGVYLSGGVPLVENCTIRRNTASNGGGVFASGSTATLRGCTIESNTAEFGGGLYVDSAACTVIGSTIAANTADLSGGGVHCQNAPNAVVDHNWITRNTSHGNGGGAAVVSGATRLPNNVLAENAADGATPAGQGGGIYCQAASPVVTNNTIVRNTAVEGGGIACRSGAKPCVYNSIVAFGSSGQYTDATSVPYHTKNCFYGNAAYDYQGVQPAPGNVHSDPRLVDVAGRDYHLGQLSPCFNKGDSTKATSIATDIDGESRLVHGAVDIGADEYGSAIGSIGEARKLPYNEIVCIGPAVVTHVASPSAFWMESGDRTSGISVYKANHGLLAGMRVSVVGSLSVMWTGEQEVSATYIIPQGSGSIEPVYVTNRSLGGGPFFYDPVTKGGQRGVSEGVGLNNIGILVCTTGRVTGVVIGQPLCFYIDDGSRVSNTSGQPGILVSPSFSMPALPEGTSVRVVGTSSIYRDGSSYFRTIRPRNVADVVVLQ